MKKIKEIPKGFLNITRPHVIKGKNNDRIISVKDIIRIYRKFI